MSTNNPPNKMPILFVGHGNPMYAIEQNEFTEAWRQLGLTLPRPKAILSISAHWETNGSFLTAMEQPATIHDFGGFPRELHAVQYPALGSPTLATEITSKIQSFQLDFDHWGLDHGTWSILKHIYPKADIPVVQMSLNRSLSIIEHYKLGQQLAFLRNEGILIIGSGNIVHNLQLINWRNEEAYHDWALEANTLIKSWILEGNVNELADYQNKGKAINLAIPTPEHLLPLVYIMAIQNDTDKISFFNDKLLMGSLSMTSLIMQ